MLRLVSMFLLVIPLGAKAACGPTGSFLRGSEHAYATTLEVSRIGDGYELQLSTFGQKLADGNRTVGAIRGRLEMSMNGCAGAYLAPTDECSIFVVFNRRGAEVHQFGHCHFGHDAWAGGKYPRIRSNEKRRGALSRPIKTQ